MDKKIKVGILTTSFPAYKGHIQSPFIYELAKSLGQHKDVSEVKVVCPLHADSCKAGEVMDGIKINRFPFAKKLTSAGGIPSNLKHKKTAVFHLFSFLAGFYFQAKSFCYDCDILHAQWTLSALVGALVKQKNQRLILTTRGAAFNLALKNWLMRRVVMFVLKRCDYITPNNKEHKQRLLELGIPEKKIAVVPNGIDIKKFKPRNKWPIRKRLGISKEKKIILFVGWLIPRKGCGYLLKAMPFVIKQNKNIGLIIIGEGILEKNLKDLAGKLQIMDYVAFIGSKPPNEIPFWMNAADILVLPSLSEGRPNVVGEALASGLPVIATDVNGTPDFIDNNKNGFLVPAMDSLILAERINLLLKSTALKNRLVKNSRASLLKSNITWQSCANAYVKIYKKLFS